MFAKARTILVENEDKLICMAEALLKYETISREQINDVMAGKEPREPSNWTPKGPTGGAAEAVVKEDLTKTPKPSLNDTDTATDSAMTDPTGEQP